MKVIFKSPSKQRSSVSTQPKQIVNKAPDYPSYSELKIVLESVKKIKQQAQQQIEYIKAQNQKIKEQRDTLKTILQSYSIKDQQLAEIKKQFADKYALEIDQLKKQISQINKNNVKYQIQNQKLNYILENFESEVKDLREKLYQKEKQQRKLKKQLEQIGLIKDEVINEQLINIIKVQFTDITELINLSKKLSHNLKELQPTKFALETQTFNKQIQIREMEKQINAYKLSQQERLKYLSSNDLRIEQKQQQVINLNDKLTKQIKELQTKLQNQTQNNKVIIINYETLIQKLNQQVDNFKKQQIKKEIQITNLMKQQKNKEQNKKYEQLVKNVCEKSKDADYERILNRIKHLEKYRSQHYYNNEKIQYLCRLLDN